MTLRIIKPEVIKDKTILLRVDFNVPLTNKDGRKVVVDNTRIKKALPTIKLLQQHNCKIIMLSHLGRPGGKIDEELRLEPLATELSSLLEEGLESETEAIPQIKTSQHLVGSEVEALISNLKAKEILILENTRFDPREKENDLKLAEKLASYADLYVNEGFSVSHRAHVSTAGITNFLPAYAGLAFSEEYQMLTQLTKDPKKPFVAVIGGAKISDKIEAIRNLTKIADVVLVGGGIANNFIKAEGIEVYQSYLEEEKLAEKKNDDQSFVELAFDLLEENKVDKMLLNDYIPLPKIIYPSDVVAAEEMKKPSWTEVVSLTDNKQQDLYPDLMFLDIGPKTQRLYRDIILQAGTVFWNGPMGVFEEEAFSDGTKAIASAVAKTGAETTIGGGDTLRAIKNFGLEGRFDHVSAAGGAALDLLAGHRLPGLEPLLESA